MNHLLTFLVLVVLPSISLAEGLGSIDQTELLKLTSENNYVVALFCPSKSMQKCKELEDGLTGIREDLMEVVNGDVTLVKLVDSKMVEDYMVGKIDKPVVIMFRSGLPVIYDGPGNEEMMLDSLIRFKEPGVQELTDNSFEHLTQAATGATTGDWLVMFFTPSCHICHRMTAALETLACKYRGRSSVARVNKETTGEKTARRFELPRDDKPDIILFRLGRMYRYKVEKYDMESITSFITGFYKNYPAESIPLPLSPFDEIVQLGVDYIKANPALGGTCLGVPFVLLLAVLVIMTMRSSDQSEEEEEAEEEEAEDEEGTKKEN